MAAHTLIGCCMLCVYGSAATDVGWQYPNIHSSQNSFRHLQDSWHKYKSKNHLLVQIPISRECMSLADKDLHQKSSVFLQVKI